MSDWLSIADNGPGGPFTVHITGLTTGSNPLFTPGANGGSVLNVPIPGQNGLENFDANGNFSGLSSQAVTNSSQQRLDQIRYLQRQAVSDPTNNGVAVALAQSLAQTPGQSSPSAPGNPAFANLSQALSFFGLAGTPQGISAGIPAPSAAASTPGQTAITSGTSWNWWLVVGVIVFVLFLLFRR